MANSLLNQALEAWEQLAADGFDLFLRIGGESPFRVGALRGLHSWIAQVRTADAPIASSLSSEETTFCLFELAPRAEKQPEFLPIAVAALMMAMTREEPIAEKDADLFDNAFEEVVMRFVYDRLPLEDCLELRLFITSILEANLVSRGPTRLVKILVDAALLYYLGESRGYRGPVLGRPDVLDRYVKKMELVCSQTRGFQSWGDLLDYLLYDISKEMEEHPELCGVPADASEPPETHPFPQPDNSAESAEVLPSPVSEPSTEARPTILSQALAAWGEFTGEDFVVARDAQDQSDALHDIYDWLKMAESSAKICRPAFPARSNFGSRDLSFHAYGTSDGTLTEARLMPIAIATLMMALSHDPPVDFSEVEDTDLSALDAVRSLLVHGNLEDILEFYFFASMVLESYSGDPQIVKRVVLIIEAALTRYLHASRGAIGHVSDPTQAMAKCTKRAVAICEQSNLEEDWLSLIDLGRFLAVD